MYPDKKNPRKSAELPISVFYVSDIINLIVSTNIVD